MMLWRLSETTMDKWRPCFKRCLSREISELTLEPRDDSKEVKTDVLEQAVNNPQVDSADTTLNPAKSRMAL